MSEPVPPTEWTRNVERQVRKHAGAGIGQAPATPLFDWCEHVAIHVAGLQGMGVIHQSRPDRPFNLCVFVPSERTESGYTEVLERTLESLDDLPEKVDQWRAFQDRIALLEQSTGLESHQTWLAAVAKDCRQRLDSIQTAARLREEGDMAGAWQAAGFEVRLDRELPADTPPEARERILADFDAVAPDLLAWHLPRDPQGKPLKNRRAPLFRYDRDKRRHSDYCLLLSMSTARRDPHVISASWIAADQQTARLDATPEYFDLRVADKFAPEILGLPRRQTRSLWSPRSTSRSLAAQSLRLQYEGRFEEVSKLCEIDFDELIDDCRQVRRAAPMCTCCAPIDRQLIAWSELLKLTLTGFNFPRVVALALRDQQRREGKPRREPIPILPFPLQRHTRKAHLALDLRDSLRPRLTIDTSGSPRRLPIPAWRRPVEVDLLRAGLLEIDQLPAAVARQLGLD